MSVELGFLSYLIDKTITQWQTNVFIFLGLVATPQG